MIQHDLIYRLHFELSTVTIEPNQHKLAICHSNRDLPSCNQRFSIAILDCRRVHPITSYHILFIFHCVPMKPPFFFVKSPPFFAKNAPSFPKDNARDARVGASGVSRARPPADFGDLGDLGLLGERGVRTWRRHVMGAEPPEAAPNMAGKYPGPKYGGVDRFDGRTKSF